MSRLENLPLEVFRGITSYLAFFDKKTLSCVSKQCHISVEVPTCPDRLSWLLFVCRLPPSHDLAKKLFQHPHGLILLVRDTAKCLIEDVNWTQDETSNRWYFHEQSGSISDHSVSPLVLPYFCGPFPEATIAHMFLEVTHKFAADVGNYAAFYGQYVDALWAYMVRLSWIEIESVCSINLRRLAHRKPIEEY